MHLKITFDRQLLIGPINAITIITDILIFTYFIHVIFLSYMIKKFACHLNQCDYAQNNLIIFEMIILKKIFMKTLCFIFLFIPGSRTRLTLSAANVRLQSHTKGPRVDRTGTTARDRART